MDIQSSFAVTRQTPVVPGTSSVISSLPVQVPARQAEQVEISAQAIQRLQAEQAGDTDNSVSMDTNLGTHDIALDDYFTPQPQTGTVSLESCPLLLPTGDNIQAIQQYISGKIPTLLTSHGIPQAPESVRYGPDGQMILPDNYPYADEFKQAVNDDPALANAMKTVSVLTEVAAAAQKTEGFRQAYEAASSPEEIAAVLNRFSYLFSADHQNADVALTFNSAGEMGLAVDGRAFTV